MKTFKIALAKTLTANGKDYVVYTTTCGRSIFRTPKQTINDLQGSGRALTLNANVADQGFAGMNAMDRATFVKAVLTTRGADIVGDVRDHKAGDTYIDYNTNETKTYQKDGITVEGFLQIPFTEAELMREALAVSGAAQMLAMFGLAAPTLNVTHTPVETLPENTGVVTATPAEAFDIPEEIAG